MGKCIDLTGQKFGRLTVIKRVENKNNQSYWLCKCECGTYKIIYSGHLKRGKIKSCGCLIKENGKNLFKHGLSHTKLHYIWWAMKQRCYDKNNKRYNCYGGKGIIICEDWKNDFKQFYNWSMNNGYQENLSIDRINVNGNYEPDNCRWADAITQANNKTNNHYITFNDETHTLMEWSRKLNIKHTTLCERLKRGWSIEKTLTLPLRSKNNDNL